jgi:hypothetical protein
LGVVGDVVDTAELGDDDRLDAVPHGGRYLRVGDLVGTDAFAIVLDENAGRLAAGNVAVAFAWAAGEHPAGRKAMSA